MRKQIVIGNWKMQLIRPEAEKLISAIGDGLSNNLKADIVVCPSYVHLPIVKELLSESIALGSQNMYWEDKGAYTGAVSGFQLEDIGCEYVIIGHSERRKFFSVSDKYVNLKTKAALKNNLIPIICVGENKDQREQGKALEIVQMQVKKALEGISEKEIGKIIFAYEPVWAIGTGVSAKPEDAVGIVLKIRELIRDISNNDIADTVRLVYGGSVNVENITGFVKNEQIDGVLAGGVSLKAKDFIKIIEIVNYKK
jgi:triosephosphate isomerase